MNDCSKFNIHFAKEGLGTAPSRAFYSKSLGEQRFSGMKGAEPLIYLLLLTPYIYPPSIVTISFMVTTLSGTIL